MKVLEKEIRFRNGYSASPRIIWNGGFWDGVHDAKIGRRRHLGSIDAPLPSWSPFYMAGYQYGIYNPNAENDSTAFWQEFFVKVGEPTLKAWISRESKSRIK